MHSQLQRQGVLWLLVAVFVVCAVPAAAQSPTEREADRRQAAAEAIFQQRIDGFTDDVHRFYEVSGELVSYRVLDELTSAELNSFEDKTEELHDRAGRLISFLVGIVPQVRGNTDDLWIIKSPPDDEETLEDRLTLVLALVYRIEPKIEFILDLLNGEGDPAIEVEDLIFEASLPYLVVGGLELIQDLALEIRRLM